MAWRYDEAKIERQRAERERRDLEEMDNSPEAAGLCYFFGGTAGILKIGYTRSIWARINRLKSNCGPYKMGLLAVAPGGSTRERHYHRKFGQYAVGGEWFDRVPEIDAEIFDAPVFYIEREYGEWPDAGWMPRHVALGFIVASIAEYRASVDRNPEGEKPQALSAQHESAAPKADAHPSPSPSNHGA